jgi:hypothetical protein
MLAYPTCLLIRGTLRSERALHGINDKNFQSFRKYSTRLPEILYFWGAKKESHLLSCLI